MNKIICGYDMVKGKRLTLFIIFTICILAIISNFENSSIASLGHSNMNILDLPENYTIDGVPYISQETDTYCAYAGHTMIFKYLGINTSLDEV